MTALLVVPDYLSHYLPFAAVGTALRGRGHEVVVATGPGLAARVRADGFEHRELRLGASRNTGVAPAGEQERLRAFLESTRAGAFATLRHQAEQRRHDLLWEPVAVAERLAAILDELRPELVVSDQLAYGASVALRAIGRPFASFLPGHPSQLPLPGETFGVPPRFPPGLAPTAAELTALRSLAAEVARDFTHAFNDALRLLEPRAAPVDDAFAAGSPWLTLVDYPAALDRKSVV